MASLIHQISSNPLGRVAHLIGRPLVHFFRRAANPDVPLDHKVSTVLYGDRKISLEHRRWSPDDALALKQCFTHQQYNMPVGALGAKVERIYKDILASGKTPIILDCGANIGASVAWFAARYPEAHIIAVEPSAENFALLQRNAAGLDVDLRLAGIGPEDGHAFLDVSPGDMGHQTTSREGGLPIEMVSVATLLAAKPASRYAPFLLKVDIEGGEQSLFSGDTSAINQFPLIILEPHDWMMPGRLTSQPFFKFHAAAGREFAMNHENIASIALQTDPVLVPGASQTHAELVH